MQIEFLFSGFGGQGMMFAGQLLAYAGMENGLEVTWIPSYGPEMRGGTAHCITILSDQPIGSPIVRHPQVIMAFNLPSFEKYQSDLKADGILIYNQSLIASTCTRLDVVAVPIRATQIADELGNPKLANMVMLGAALAYEPILSIADIQKSLERHIPANRRHLLEANQMALTRGAAIRPLVRV